jgi:aspartate kinase
MIIMKFGGTSNQDARAMANVAAIIKAHVREYPVVVVSAIAQATNMLERAGTIAAEGDTATALALMKSLFDRHFSMLDALIHDTLRHQELSAFMKKSFDEISNLIHGVAIVRELTPRTLDTFCSYGELLSSKLVAATLLETGVGTRWLDTKDFMITDDHFTAAMPMMDLVESRLTPLVSRAQSDGLIPVTQGFIGVTSRGVRTTMGRESSDYSASIIGYVLNAAEIQIWTDVDGVLTTDPGIVPSAKKVKQMSFEEAFDISYFGAKVLHPHTMLPAIDRNIPVRIVNSRRPSSSGTLITGSLDRNRSMIKSISYKKNIVLGWLTPHRRLGQYNFWDQIFNILTKYNIPVHLVNTSEIKIILAFEQRYLSENLTGDLSAIGNLRLADRKVIITLVGEAIQESGEIPSRIFHALNGIPVNFISSGASPSSINLVLEENSIEDAIRKLHEEFFNTIENYDVFEIPGNP